MAQCCCYNGRYWHKPPANLGLKNLPVGQSLENCYMNALGSCVAPISGEHVISESVCRILMGDGEFSISGVPWLDSNETKIIAPLRAKCLCAKHNSALSPLDAAAQYFFDSLKSYLEHDGGFRHALISGHDLERWLLKTAKAAAVSKNLARGGVRLSGTFARDEAILDMLDDPRHWPEGSGLYCAMWPGDVTENNVRFQLQPFTNERDEIDAIAINVFGFRFALLLDVPDWAKWPSFRHAKLRPGQITISYPNSKSIITISWIDGRRHEDLTLHWVRGVPEQ